MQPFSIPVQITLQGGRRRQGRPALAASGRSDGDPLKVHPKLPSSAGEDRATLLGIAMMASSVPMFFLLGTTVLKPFLLSSNREESNCTTIHTRIAEDWLDFTFTCEGSCQDQGGYPCLQVFVNLTHSGQKVLLHYDDEAVRNNPKCFYTPKCHRDRNDLLNSARDIKEFFDHRNGTFTCFYSPDGQMGVVLRKSGHKKCQVCFPRDFPSSDYWIIPGKTDMKLEKSQFEAQATQQSSKLKQQQAYCGSRKHQCSCRYQRQLTFGTVYNGQGGKTVCFYTDVYRL